MRLPVLGLAAVLLAGWAHETSAGPLRERIEQRRADREFEGEDAATRRGALPTGARLLRDLAYGDDRRQRMDVYIPADARAVPVLFLVHGGGWRRGDKAHGRLLDNKLAYWLPAGFIVVSINYRLLPQADVLTQRDDIVAALAKAQSLAPSWGGDPTRFVLMGHSAGAHLLALVASAPRDARIAQSWLGSVLLDSGALDVERLMNEQHHDLFDDAFGKDPAFWIATSPIRQLVSPTTPWLAVCSSRRKQACDQVGAFARKVRATGGRIDELPMDLSHGAINEALGLPGDYTRQVDDFLRRVGALR